MGFLSDFFSDKTDRRSYVLDWLERQDKILLQSTNMLAPQHLFTGVIGNTTKFGQELENLKEEEKRTTLIDIEDFKGDSTLFELGCYLHFRVDLWLYENALHLRKTIMLTFIDSFEKLFQKALRSKNVPSLFNERITGYGQLIQKGVGTEEFFQHLIQLIIKTKNNRQPKEHDFSGYPITQASAIDVAVITELIISWEKEVVPHVLRAVEGYCKLFDENC